MSRAALLLRGFEIAYPAHLEEEYKQQLLELVNELKSLTMQIILDDRQFQASFGISSRQDDLVDDFLEASRAINTAIAAKLSKTIRSVAGYFDSVKGFIDRSFNNSAMHIAKRSALILPANVAAVSASNIDINLLRRMWIDSNTKLIRDIPAKALDKIRIAIYESASNGESVASLARRLESIFDMTKARAKLIARDQIGKLKCNLSRHNDLQHGITQYEWSTCKDGAVRESHKVMQGKICSWLDASIYKNKIDEPWKKRSSIGGVEKHAGEDIRCRCTNIMLMEIM